jgi:Dyp-type peroxidase family
MRSLSRSLAIPGVALLGVVLLTSLAPWGFSPRDAEAKNNEDTDYVLDLGKVGIDPKADLPLLNNLQGNILREHGRDHGILLFLEFDKAKQMEVKAGIRWFAETYVTTAAAQDRDVKRANLFAGFYLSKFGYKKIGYWPGRFDTRHFAGGMKEARRFLNDPPAQDWEPAYQKDLDGLIFLAHNDWPTLQKKAAAIQKELAPRSLMVVHQEVVRRLRNKAGHEIEHFGYPDGISDPLFYKADLAKVKRTPYDPAAPLGLVLTKDPYAPAEQQALSCGSFLVLRKLHQDVEGFQQALQDLAKALGVNKDLAGAYVVGRFKDGTPVVKHPRPVLRPGQPLDNDFDYAGDPDGLKCPLHAHIRKMNPRGSARQQDPTEAKHRIVRWSLSYGVKPDCRTSTGKDVGMMFLCFQADIRNQFAFLQNKWGNNHDFVRVGVGPDPLIGQGKGSVSDSDQCGGEDEEETSTGHYPVEWGKGTPRPKELDFPRFVTLKGGEYFFAPSLAFLKSVDRQDR